MRREISILILSPHSDDGVLSLGAAMARWAREGTRVELLTVLALDPASDAPTGGWDRRAGFETEAAAARARRAEDVAACALLGITPRWLPFGSVDFDRHGDDAAVWGAMRSSVETADIIMAPGSPLSHPDHRWLHELVSARVASTSLALYAEQPYALRAGAKPFSHVGVGRRDRAAKWRAVRCYRSQLPLLGMKGFRRSPLRLAWSDERVAWPPGREP